MCVDCGCEHDARLRLPAALAAQGALPRVKTRRVSVEVGVLAKNDRQAAANRARLAERGVLALNLLSSPGAGKTTLLERTIKDLGAELKLAVIEGDQATDNDAQRIRAAGCRAVQINTGTGCHLDADMVARGLDELEPAQGSTVLIENVGNLVCPALFDLGEQAKVVVASVTDGEDKPLKYPHMFRAASVIVLNKVDLLPHVDFDVARFVECARRVNATAPILQLSATRGSGTAGLASWYDWLRAQAVRARAQVAGGVS
jgi:hydrogenase nickel incorporation protein HypB